jgi:hypothetical protein
LNLHIDFDRCFVCGERNSPANQQSYNMDLILTHALCVASITALPGSNLEKFRRSCFSQSSINDGFIRNLHFLVTTSCLGIISSIFFVR